MDAYEIARDGGQARVTLGEQLTAANVKELQGALKAELGAGVRTLVMDLAQTATLDSTGIGLLIAANNSLAALEGSVSLLNVSPDIFKLLQSMRLVSRLHATAAQEVVSNG